MNYISHFQIAREIDPDLGPAFAVGSMLPDLEGMAGTKVDPGALPEEVVWGIELHRSTDRVFHSQTPIFSDLQRPIREDLTEFIGRGAAKACAHVGTEMMLDGTLLDDEAMVASYRLALAWVQANRHEVAAGARAPAVMDSFLDDFSLRGIPVHYRSPQGTAGALQRMLARRHPLLAFSEDKLPLVTEVLTIHQPEIKMAQEGLFAHVIAGIRAG